MPLPTTSSLNFNRLLTDYAVAYGQDIAKDYVADRVATVKRVSKQSANYGVWSKADFFRSTMQPRAAGSHSAGGGFRLDTTNTYSCKRYALNVPITDEDMVNSDLDLGKAKTRYLSMQAKLKRDLILGTGVFATGLWTSNTEQTGVSSAPSANQFLQWNDEASTPILDIQNQQSVIEASTGLRANKAVCNAKVLRALRRHPDLLDLTKYTSAGLVPMQALLDTLELDEIIVGRAVQNTAADGQTAALSRVFGNHFLLLHQEPSPTDMAPTAVTSFVWSEFDNVTESGVPIFTWYDPARKSDIYEAEMHFDVKITANDLGVMMLSAVA
jgi:hypothetical protein